MFKIFQKSILWKFRFKKFFLLFYRFSWLLLFFVAVNEFSSITAYNKFFIIDSHFSFFFHFNHAQIEQIIFKHFHSFRFSTMKIFSFFFSSSLVIIYRFLIDHFFNFNQCHQRITLFCSTKSSSSINFKHTKQIRQLSDETSYKIKLL